MKRISLLSAVAILTTPFASARLGDTPSQCVERYGESLQPLDVKNVEDGAYAAFNMKGYKIGIQFVSGKCVSISYNKINRELKLSYDEIITLMKANKDAGYWKKVQSPAKGRQQWENKEFKYKADYFTRSGFFLIKSKDSELFAKKKEREKSAADSKRKAEKAKSDAANLKGF